MAKLMKKSANYDAFPVWLMAVFVLIAACIIAGSHWFYKSQARQIEQKINEELKTISHLKSDQIAQWRGQRLADAGEIMASPFFIQGVKEWLARSNPDARKRMLDRFAAITHYQRYKNILLADVNGAVQISLYDAVERLPEEDLHVLAMALKDQKPILTDFHECRQDGSPVIDVIVPLYSSKEKPLQAIGVLVLQIDPRQFLYPMIQTWPMPSRTAENLLVRREGDYVVFLNELRHTGNAALQMKIPVSRTNVPAVRAVLGEEGVVSGTDYRGKPVVAALLPIPDSSWFMVTKMDTAEAFEQIRVNKWMVIVMSLGLTAAILAGFGLLWQYMRKVHYKTLVREIQERKRAEDIIRDEQQKFQFLTEKAPFGMVMVGKEGRFKYVNPRFTEIFGYDAADVPDGRTWFQKAYPDPDYRRRVIASWKEEMKKAGPGEKRPKTYLVRCKDGTEKFIYFVPIQLETGDHLMFCDDISERIEAETKLKESEERYRALFDRSMDCVYIHDFKGNFIDINDAALHLLGYEKKDIPSLNLSSLLSPDQFHKTRQILDELFKTGYQKNITEFRITRKDGQEIFIEAKASLVFHDGKPYAVQGVGRDITRRKRVEDELRKLAMVIQYSNELVNLASLQGRMIFLNESGAKMLGIDRNEVEKHHVLDVMPEQHRDTVGKEILSRLVSGDTWEGEIQYRNIQSGELIDAHAMAFPIKDPETGEILCLANVSLDITARKRAEQARARLEEQLVQSQKLESIGRLAGGVAHDFNNMLAIIIGYADIVLKDLHESNPAHEKTKEILRAAGRARDLTRQLLAFARKQTLDMTHLDLNQVVSAFEKMLRRALRENVMIKLHLSSVPCVFQGDVGQIEQIILNIALNSQDAMPDGGTLVIETRTLYLDASYVKIQNGMVPGNYVMLGMSDTGMGMSRDTQEKVFEPFYTTKEVGKGTGLGLSTVYGIVKQHGGHIHVYSEPGKGTSFKIYFPRIEKTVETDRDTDSNIISEMGKETVLVVEDNEQVRNLSCEILKLHGYKVIDTPDGKTAMEAAKLYPGRIHLLITDVIMPDMNGKELHRQLSQIHLNIKTLFMSGYPEDIIGHHGVLDAGINFIQKPFSLHDFVARVRQVLDAKPSQS
jgi:PAS domain S-box-containing protein